MPLDRRIVRLFFYGVAVMILLYAFSGDPQSVPPSFCADCGLAMQVVERGTLRYDSGQVVELKNDYRVAARLITTGKRVRFGGTVRGAMDERLGSIVTEDRFDITLDPAMNGEFCPPRSSRLYPMGFRRILLRLPRNEFYAGKVWYAPLCGVPMGCRYEAGEGKEGVIPVMIDCSAQKSPEERIAIRLDAAFDPELGWYRSINGVIRLSGGPLDSRWDISEQAERSPETNGAD